MGEGGGGEICNRGRITLYNNTMNRKFHKVVIISKNLNLIELLLLNYYSKNEIKL